MKPLFIAIAAAVALSIFTVVDVALTDRRRVRGVPKAAWLFIGVLPVVGAALWFTVGKSPLTAVPRPSAPDDDVTFLRDLRAKEDQDERIRRLEQELAELDDDSTKD